MDGHVEGVGGWINTGQVSVSKLVMMTLEAGMMIWTDSASEVPGVMVRGGVGGQGGWVSRWMDMLRG